MRQFSSIIRPFGDIGVNVRSFSEALGLRTYLSGHSKPIRRRQPSRPGFYGRLVCRWRLTTHDGSTWRPSSTISWRPERRSHYEEARGLIIKNSATKANLQGMVHNHLFRHGYAINFLN